MKLVLLTAILLGSFMFVGCSHKQSVTTDYSAAVTDEYNYHVVAFEELPTSDPVYPHKCRVTVENRTKRLIAEANGDCTIAIGDRAEHNGSVSVFSSVDDRLDSFTVIKGSAR
jgi:hypothetical protein